MNNIQIVPIAGDQSLFRVNDFDNVLAIEYTYDEGGSDVMFDNDYLVRLAPNEKIVAIRYIIKVSIWSVADLRTGKQPDVGAIIIDDEYGEVPFVGEDERGFWWFRRPDGIIEGKVKGMFRPVESPNEMAIRLRAEWCENTRNMTTEMIYDAMTNGTLPVPVKR